MLFSLPTVCGGEETSSGAASADSGTGPCQLVTWSLVTARQGGQMVCLIDDSSLDENIGKPQHLR